MNSLSWLLYAANVVPNFGWAIMILSLILVGGGAISFIGTMVGMEEVKDKSRYQYNTYSREASASGVTIEGYIAELTKPFRTLWKWTIGLITIGMFGIITSCLFPDRNTILLIAGSEAGEKVVTSPAGQEILSDIKAVIKGQLDQLKPNKEK